MKIKIYAKKLLAINLVSMIILLNFSCKKDKSIASIEQVPDTESSQMFNEFKQSSSFTQYSTEVFGDLITDQISYKQEDGIKLLVIPIKDQYLDGQFYKRGLIAYFNEDKKEYTSKVVEISVPISELNRIKTLNAETKTDLSGSMKIFSTDGQIYIAANYKKGTQIEQGVSYTRLPSNNSGTYRLNFLQNKKAYVTELPPGLNLDEEESRGWFGCMSRFFSSDAGTATNLLGLAGGIGCVPCSGAGGAIAGVAALGCLAEIRRLDQPLPVSPLIPILTPIEDGL